jgi:hypothetical protein
LFYWFLQILFVAAVIDMLSLHTNSSPHLPHIIFRGEEATYKTRRSEIRCALMLRHVDLVVNIKVAIGAVVSLYSVVKQRLKCNTGKVCDCLIQFLLTMINEKRIQHLTYVHSDFPNAHRIVHTRK